MTSVNISLSTFRDAGGELVYNNAESNWYTSDSLGFIYRFDNNANKFQQLQTPATDNEITCFAINSSGSECVLGYTNSIHTHKFPSDIDAVKEGYLCRRTLPITSVKYDSKDANVIISSKEPDIIIQSLVDTTVKTKISSFSIGVRSFSLCNENKFMCVVCEDGSLYLHSLQTDIVGNVVGNNFMKKLNDMVNVAAIRNCASTGFKVSWCPSVSAGPSSRLVVPSKDGCAVVLTYNATSNDWEETPIVSGDDDINHNKIDLNLAVYSRDGKHIATADLSGNVVVWDTARYNPVKKFVSMSNEPLFDLVWGDKNDILLVSATSFVKIDDVITTAAAEAAAEVEVVEEATTAPAVAEISDADMASFFDTVEEPIEASVYKPEARSSLAGMLGDTATAIVTPAAAASAAESAASNKLNRLQKASTAGMDDDDDDIFNSDGPSSESTWKASNAIPESMGESIKEMKKIGRATLDDDDDEKMLDDDDYGDGYADETDLPVYDKAQLEELLKTALPAAAALKMQEAFQPASTDYNEKRRRYLCWNHAGDITCREENIAFRYEVKVDGRNEILQNHHEFTRASLAREGAVFATDPEEREDSGDVDDGTDDKKKSIKGSTVFYKAFKGFQIPNFDFEYVLDDGDAVVAVAAGSGWCAVATEKGLLHVLSSTGIPISISWLKGPVVSIIGKDNKLAVIYHFASPLHNGTFCMSLELHEITFTSKKSMFNGSIAVPLSKSSKLQWCGFDEEFGNVVVMDSEYMVSMLVRTPSFEWVPIIDLSKHLKPGHEFWPVRVVKDAESNENKIVYILLNGEKRPEIYPKPTPSTKAVSLPLLSLHSRSNSSSANKAAKESEDFMRKLMWESLKGSQYEAEKEEMYLRGFDVSSFDIILEKQKNNSDKNVLSLISLACDTQNVERAFDLVDRLQTNKGRDYAKFIANKKSCPKVAIRVEELQVALFEQEQQMQLMQQQASGGYPMEQENQENQANQQSSSLFESNYGQETEEEAPAKGTLSSRAFKRQNSFEEANSKSSGKDKAPPSNPFLKQSPMESPSKRKSVFESVKSLKNSPSPKRPMLSKSPFSKQAQTKQSLGKKIL